MKGNAHLLEAEATIDKMIKYTKSTYNTYVSHQGDRTYSIYAERNPVLTATNQHHFILHIAHTNNPLDISITLTRDDHPNNVFHLQSAVYSKSDSLMIDSRITYGKKQEQVEKTLPLIKEIIYHNKSQDTYDISCENVQQNCSDIRITFYQNNEHEKHEIDLFFG
jgi:hypothetical protein